MECLLKTWAVEEVEVVVEEAEEEVVVVVAEPLPHHPNWVHSPSTSRPVVRQRRATQQQPQC